MKTLILILFLSLTVNAKEFTFKYKVDEIYLEIKQNAPDWKIAFSRAAQQCFDFYKKEKPYSEKYLLDVIDVCANPR